jgi:hypothetical protein
VSDGADDQASLEREIRALLAELGVEGRDLDALPGEDATAERDLARILSTPQVARADKRVSRRPRRTVRVVGFLAVAAAIAVGLVVVRPWTGDAPASAVTPPLLHLPRAGDDLEGGSRQAAPAEFRRLAAAAAQQPPAGSGPVQHVVLDSWVLTTDEQTGKARPKSVLTPVTNEKFFTADGRVRMLEHRGDALDSDGRVAAPATSKAGSTDSDETFDGPEEGPAYADDLPTDPVALEKRLVPGTAECKGMRASCLVARVTFLHYGYVLKPSTARAVWLVLANQTDFAYAGRTRDRLDRPAVAFTSDASDAGRKLVLLADPATGAFMGSEEVLVKDSEDLGLKAPAVIEFVALATSARVDEDDVPDPSSTTSY